MWIQKLRAGVTHIAYSLDGRTLYTLDTGGVLTAWDTVTRIPRRLADFAHTNLWSQGGLDPIAGGRLIHRSRVFSLLGPSGEVIASADLTPGRYGYEQIRLDGRVFYIEDDSPIISGWDLEADAPVPGFTIPNVGSRLARPLCFDIAPDGRRIIIFTLDASGVLFDVTHDLALHNPVLVAGARGAYRARFSPDGSKLVLFSLVPESVAIWDIESRTPTAREIECVNTTRVFAFNPTVPQFAALNKARVLTLFSLDDGRAVRSLDFALGRAVRCVAFAPDGLTCAVGGTNKQFAVFDVDV